MKRIEGYAAIEMAKELGIKVQTYADAIDDGGEMDPDSDAVWEKMEADPQLVYIDIED